MTQADWVKKSILLWNKIVTASQSGNRERMEEASEDYHNFISKVESLAQQRTEKKCLERVKYRLETYVWDGNIGDGLAKDGGHDYLIEVMENRKLLTKAVLSDLLK